MLAGTVFAILWASASAVTKIGLLSAQPLVIALARFAVASVFMLVVAHAVLRQRLPRDAEWKSLAIYGILNVSIYLGLYVIAMQEVSAGLGSLFVAVNPVLISLMGALWFRQRITLVVMMSFLLCISGMLIAAFPLLEDSYATPWGVGTLFLSMLAYSAGAVYFAQKKWHGLHILTINGWQTLLGGLFLFPCMVVFYEPQRNTYDIHFWGAVIWLALPVSFVAVQLWLLLLRKDPVKASFWLFLCPVIGFVIAAVIMKEPIGLYTLAGVALVIAGLYLVQYKKIQPAGSRKDSFTD